MDAGVIWTTYPLVSYEEVLPLTGVAVNSQTNFIYVANASNSQAGDPGNITVMNGATNATTTLKDSEAKNPVELRHQQRIPATMSP